MDSSKSISFKYYTFPRTRPNHKAGHRVARNPAYIMETFSLGITSFSLLLHKYLLIIPRFRPEVITSGRGTIILMHDDRSTMRESSHLKNFSDSWVSNLQSPDLCIAVMLRPLSNGHNYIIAERSQIRTLCEVWRIFLIIKIHKLHCESLLSVIRKKNILNSITFNLIIIASKQDTVINLKPFVTLRGFKYILYNKNRKDL